MKLDNKVKEKVLKIMELALIKNEKTKNTVFVDFYGHTNELQVQIHENGWKAYEKPNYDEICYFKLNNANEKLEELIKKLEGLD